MKTLIIILTLSLLSCSKKPELTPKDYREIISELFSIEKTEDISNIKFSSKSFFTTIIKIKFNCTEDYFSEHFIKSPMLENYETRELYFEQSSIEKWWKTKELKNIKFHSKNFQEGNDNVSMRVLTGQENDKFTVYIRLIYETIHKEEKDEPNN